MSYAELAGSSPYAWLLAAALAAALMLRWILLAVFARESPTRVRDRRITAALLAATVTVALLAATLVAHGPTALVSREALVFFAVVVAVGTTAMVFLRSVGVPLLFILSGLGVLSVYLAHPWTPVVDRYEPASITVLNTAGESVRLELRPRGGDGGSGYDPNEVAMLSISGEALGTEVEIVRYHPYWFFLGRSVGARLVAIEGYGSPGDEEPTDQVSVAEPCGDAVCRIVRRHMREVPGIDVERVRSTSVPVEPLSRRTVVINSSGTVELEEN